ncbi:DUF1127 domain-containing protein [Candidatus Puniceispirillum sp.]|jgi:uncharacterized protein YjiS (DUF1127 family)|uniref:DUF1127 domain-containing protein n=1 Tax=Candidatus Puniceispirillum sp. TaxID=2026719 RepID=UPI002FCDF1E1
MLYIYNMLKKQIIAAFQRSRHSLWSVWTRYRHAMALYKSRCQLATLDDRALDDIGISRAERAAECARPIGQDKAPWIQSSAMHDSDAIDCPAPAYLRGRPASQIRSFYNERGRCAHLR